MKRFVIFTPGTYRKTELAFYKRLCRSASRLVAVDGGCRFFVAAGMVPDVIIGDLDSVRSIPRAFREKSEVVVHSPHKDKTDLHLALEYVMGERPHMIDIVSPAVGEVDHFLGNVMLAELVDRKASSSRRPQMRIVGPDYEILWVHDERREFRGCAGDRLSVVPMSAHIKLTCSGVEYPARRLRITRGDSRSLRNRISASRASVKVEGKALVVRHCKPF